MANAYYHAQSSARVFGGIAEDYLPLHQFLDSSKEHMADLRHRAMRHHSQGVFEAERVFGPVVFNSDGTAVPTRLVAEQHIREDLGGRIPTLADWLNEMQVRPWMAQPVRTFGERARRSVDESAH